MTTSRRLFIVAIASVSLGCSKETPKPSEVEGLAATLIADTFKVSNDNWFGADKLLGSADQYRLFELHNPRTSLTAQNVTETDRMNGITLRYRLTVICDQHRSWNGKWTPWSQGIGSTFSSWFMPSFTVGEWVIEFTKVNDQWQSKNSFPVHNFVQDQDRLEGLMSDADVSQ